jgi:hypothetical protein
VAVQAIADNRVPDVLEVDTELMGAAGYRLEFQQGVPVAGFIELFKSAVGRLGGFAG